MYAGNSSVKESFVFNSRSQNAPGQIELQRWKREVDYLRALPPNLAPPESVVRYVFSKIKQQSNVPAYNKTLDPRDKYRIRPSLQYEIYAALVAHFLWFSRRSGFEHILRFYGVERVEPFAEGYTYYLIDPVTKKEYLINAAHMQIYQPCSVQAHAVLNSDDQETKDLAEKFSVALRHERINGGAHSADTFVTPRFAIYKLVSYHVYSWLNERTDHERVAEEVAAFASEPTADFLTGPQWVKKVLACWPERKDFPSQVKYEEALVRAQRGEYEAVDELRYVPLFKVLKDYRGRAYRIANKDEHGRTVSIRWAGEEDVHMVSNPDKLRTTGYTEKEVDHLFRCKVCQQVRPCTPATGGAKACCHCHGTIMDRGERTSLQRCTSMECKKECCPEYKDRVDLQYLLNKLNGSWNQRDYQRY